MKFREVDIENWNRRAAFEFFKNFEDPFFEMTTNIDVSNLVGFCKENGLSFSLACVFFSQATANEIREFRLRILDDELVEFEKVESTQTILQDDESFSFCYFEEKATLFDFDEAGKQALDKYRILNTFDVETNRRDLIYYSIIPWVSFTSFKHASKSDQTRTIPRIVFGKYFESGGRVKIPVSVEANHMIMDGIHLGKYFNLLQSKVDSPA